MFAGPTATTITLEIINERRVKRDRNRFLAAGLCAQRVSQKMQPHFC